ncbi:MAG TPA: contact-dependent growth inhibition system immunity protein [Gaiellaceae bacterium]|nr:contact-dependent growth inhibition system immunity protein [Gaiellaceae bacterium]
MLTPWQFPNLFQVFGGYLHQDFDLEFASPDEALLAAAAGQGSEQVGDAVREIDSLLESDLDDSQLHAIVERLTAGYAPELDAWEARAWLAHARRLLLREVTA